MVQHEITLDSLIERGLIIKKGFFENSNGLSRYIDIDDLNHWKHIVIRFLSDNYKGDRSISDFEKAVEIFEANKTIDQLSALIGVLKAIESIPQKIQKPIAKVSTTGVNVNVTQSQQQTQQQSQSVQLFLEAIKDELTGKQQKELESLAKEELPEDEKRTKIIDKITSFGSDVAANIIANIVTNPIIWG